MLSEIFLEVLKSISKIIEDLYFRWINRAKLKIYVEVGVIDAEGRRVHSFSRTNRAGDSLTLNGSFAFPVESAFFVNIENVGGRDITVTTIATINSEDCRHSFPMEEGLSLGRQSSYCKVLPMNEGEKLKAIEVHTQHGKIFKAKIGHLFK